MSLRDEHLQQALKHAPDNGLEPSNMVREKVLDYAGKAVKPGRESWLKRTMSLINSWRVSSWQLAGLSSVAVALLVVVMAREQLPDESIWNVAEVKDVAQNKAEAQSGKVIEQDKLESLKKEERVDFTDSKPSIKEKAIADKASMEVVGKNSPQMETETPRQLSREGRNPVAAPQMTDKSNVAVAVAVTPAVAELHDVVEQGLSEEGKSKSVDAENKGRLEAPPEKKLATTAALPATAPASEAVSVASTEQKNELERPAVGEATAGGAARAKEQSVDAVAKLSVASNKASILDEAKALGIAKANKDIQTGALRILHLGGDWPTGKPLVDDVTGYRVELVADRLANVEAQVVEQEAYNQAMREWYFAHKKSSN